MVHMKKISLMLLFTGIVVPSFATDLSESALPANQAFQNFDNQFYVGTGYGYGFLQNGYNQTGNYGAVTLGLGVERLFDIGIWARFDATLMSNYYTYSNNPNVMSSPAGNDPNLATMNLKVGYAFPLVQDELQIIPYGLVGRNTNLSANALNNNTSDSGGTKDLTVNSTQDYFLSSGLGGRLEWRLDNSIMLYADQNLVYSADMSHPNSDYSSASNLGFNTLLGAKFNVWKELQLGAQAQYSHYVLTNNPTQAQMFQMNPTDVLGGMVTIGLTY